METPEIDLQKIRPHRGSQDLGFEELCCQLASLEPRSPADVFYRKGPGADAGIECFIKHQDGSETGWQAKWFSKLGSSQITQLNKSIAQALGKHRNLKKYAVCLPIDLADARVGRARSELERWQNFVQRWEADAQKAGNKLSIELWSAADLTLRLSRNDPLYAGRLRYWFDSTLLDSAWFKLRFTSRTPSACLCFFTTCGPISPARKAHP